MNKLKTQRLCKQCFGIIKNTQKKNIFCSLSCSASYNNKVRYDSGWKMSDETKKKISSTLRKRPKVIRKTSIKNKPKKSLIYCKVCNIQIFGTNEIFCSKKCLNKEKNNNIEEDKLVGKKALKSYLINKFGPKCSICNWSEINPFSNTIPIEMDHIDGNSDNHKLSNVRLLCPNCHSLTGNAKALNKGNGKYSRIVWYNNLRKIEKEVLAESKVNNDVS